MLTNTHRIRGLNLDKSHLTIDGKPLSDIAVFAVAGGITIGDAKPVTMFQSAPGRSGGWDVTLDDQHGYPALQRREISIRIAATGDHMEINEAKTLVGGCSVRVGGLTDYGEFHGRLSVGAWEDNRDMMGTLKWSACTLTLDADPPIPTEPRNASTCHWTARPCMRGSSATGPHTRYCTSWLTRRWTT